MTILWLVYIVALVIAFVVIAIEAIRIRIRRRKDGKGVTQNAEDAAKHNEKGTGAGSVKHKKAAQNLVEEISRV